MRAFIIVCLTAVFVATGTASEPAPPFNDAEFRPFAVDGTGIIEGRIVLKARGGDAPLRGGSKVTLTPRTAYTLAFADILLGGIRTHRLDRRLANYQRTTRADPDGEFSFRNLPAGGYFITCVPRWRLPDENATISSATIVYAQVAVRNGETTRAVLQQ